MSKRTIFLTILFIVVVAGGDYFVISGSDSQQVKKSEQTDQVSTSTEDTKDSSGSKDLVPKLVN